MNLKVYFKVSAINATLLATGFLLGTVAPRGASTTVVRAQSQHAGVSQPQPQFEDISPTITAGSAGFGTLLAGRIAADKIMVQGVDIAKLQENLLNLLASKPGVFSQAEVQSVIDRARADRPLRIKIPEPPKPETKTEPKPDAKKEAK